MLIGFYRAVRRALRMKGFRWLLAITLVLLVGGTAFYCLAENWRVLDAVYFCVITLATVGYGDFSPQTDAGKLFTIFYVIAGVGILSAFIVNIFNAFKANLAEKADGKEHTREKRLP